jgi:hypothetical protein
MAKYAELLRSSMEHKKSTSNANDIDGMPLELQPLPPMDNLRTFVRSLEATVQGE